MVNNVVVFSYQLLSSLQLMLFALADITLADFLWNKAETAIHVTLGVAYHRAIFNVCFWNKPCLSVLCFLLLIN